MGAVVCALGLEGKMDWFRNYFEASQVNTG
jgi:hypothetical protein